MDDIKKDPFEEYIRQSEPSKRELGYAWYTAMGLQAVDGLDTSENRYMHVRWKMQKQDIQSRKQDIQGLKQDIQQKI